MEPDDKHYFFEGLFIIFFVAAGALLFVWFGTFERRDDVLYRIRFAESVSGLALGDVVKYRGVDVGTVKAMRIDPGDPRLVQVDVKIDKDAPVTTETKAMLKMRGITGAVSVELTGSSPNAKSLVSATPPGEVPMIPSERSSLSMFFDELPKAMRKLSGLETQAQQVLSDVGEVTKDVKEDRRCSCADERNGTDEALSEASRHASQAAASAAGVSSGAMCARMTRSHV